MIKESLLIGCLNPFVAVHNHIPSHSGMCIWKWTTVLYVQCSFSFPRILTRKIPYFWPHVLLLLCSLLYQRCIWMSNIRPQPGLVSSLSVHDGTIKALKEGRQKCSQLQSLTLVPSLLNSLELSTMPLWAGNHEMCSDQRLCGQGKTAAFNYQSVRAKNRM